MWVHSRGSRNLHPARRRRPVRGLGRKSHSSLLLLIMIVLTILQLEADQDYDQDQEQDAAAIWAGATLLDAPTLRAAHVVAGARIDLDQFAFLNEQRYVYRLAGLENRRLRHIRRGIAAKTFGRFDHLELH